MNNMTITYSIAATKEITIVLSQSVLQQRRVKTVQRIIEPLMPISIELDRGPKRKNLGIQKSRKMKNELKKVPGNAILKASL